MSEFAGVIASAAGLVYKLAKSFKGAPGEFSEISRELQSFHFVVTDLQEQYKDPTSSLNRFSTSKKSELVEMTENLVATMKELEDLYKRYKRMGRLHWLRFKLGLENLSAMRSKLTVQISTVNTFINGLNMATNSRMELKFERMEPILQEIFQLLHEQTQESLELAETVVSAQRNNNDATASWARLEMNLRTEGIPLDYIQGNRESIAEVLDSVIALNHLEGVEETDEDTIHPHESASQIGTPQNEISESKGSISSGSTSSKKQSPRISRNWASNLKITTYFKKARMQPYDQWVKGLSPEEERYRIKLMNQGFDIREIETKYTSKASPTLAGRAVYWAVIKDQPIALKLLFERGCSGNCRVVGLKTPLHGASLSQNKTIVNLLVHAGADINALDEQKQTPLHSAVIASNEEITKQLLKLRPVIDTKDKDRKTPLYYAIHAPNETIVEDLIKAGAAVNGAAVNGADIYDPSPIHDAIKMRNLNIVKYLIQGGAHVNVLNSSGDTPLISVIKSFYEYILGCLREGKWHHPKLEDFENVSLYFNIVEILLEAGAVTDILLLRSSSPRNIRGIIQRSAAEISDTKLKREMEEIGKRFTALFPES